MWFEQLIKKQGSTNEHQGCFFLLLYFGLSRLTSLQFIQYHVAGFYKPTIPQSPPSHLRDYITTMPGKSFPQFVFQALIQMNNAR
jgi:hypothetical protein